MPQISKLMLAALVAGSGAGGAMVAHPPASGTNPFEGVELIHVVDGDTIKVNLNDPAGTLPPVFSRELLVRTPGIDTPEIHGKCPKEKALAQQAKAELERRLSQARKIDLQNPSRDKYFRLDAVVLADGQNVSDHLIQQGLAVPYDGGTKTKNWCR
ncbi:MAG: thermonuclease family protein [Deltaproteobacteria bacterium]|nr:thermonuclease family protein [Deltaproteobacteria bacterium]